MALSARERSRRYEARHKEERRARRLTETEREAARERAKRYKRTPKGRANALRKNARARAEVFTLTVAWIQERIERGCEVTGLPFDLSTGDRGPYTPSLDQIEAGKGYTPENTRVVCWAVNALLGTWGDADALRIARAIVRKNQS